MHFPNRRLRRYRVSEGIRNLVSEVYISPKKLMYPIFVWDGATEEIKNLPEQFRWNISDKNLYKFLEKLIQHGLESILVFGVATEKDKEGSLGWRDDGVVQRFVKYVKKEFPELVVATDVCLCTWREDGHCGVAKDGKILNDETLDYLAKISLSHASSGADIVSPSDMMDGRVKSIRSALDKAGFENTLIMSYSVKYASYLYGPFRDAARSAPAFGDRKTYQIAPSQLREAILEAQLDSEEGTDILMVKPALFYLDVIKELRQKFQLPISAFNVSGEYSMIKIAISQGVFDEKVIMELFTSIFRAGTDILISYFVPDFLRVKIQ